MMPEWVPAYEGYHHSVSSSVRDQLLEDSVATRDRLLRPCRIEHSKGRWGTKPGTMLRQSDCRLLPPGKSHDFRQHQPTSTGNTCFEATDQKYSPLGVTVTFESRGYRGNSSVAVRAKADFV